MCQTPTFIRVMGWVLEGSCKGLLSGQLDSTKVQTLRAISESINETRHCTAASYTIRWDTGPRGVYLSTEPVSRRLAASAGKLDCTSAFPRCAGQLVAKGKVKVKEASGGQRYVRRVGSRTTGRGKARPLVLTYTHAHTAN